jgi:SRSO17 transposase
VLSKTGRNVSPKHTKLLVTHLPDATAREIVGLYQNRWSIELINQHLKSDLGLGHYQVRGERHQFDTAGRAPAPEEAVSPFAWRDAEASRKSAMAVAVSRFIFRLLNAIQLPLCMLIKCANVNIPNMLSNHNDPKASI